jgi:hypothetical protein
MGQGGDRRFRFGVIGESIRSVEDLLRRARRAKELGYSTLLLRDHLRPPHVAPARCRVARGETLLSRSASRGRSTCAAAVLVENKGRALVLGLLGTDGHYRSESGADSGRARVHECPGLSFPRR